MPRFSNLFHFFVLKSRQHALELAFAAAGSAGHVFFYVCNSLYFLLSALTLCGLVCWCDQRP